MHVNMHSMLSHAAACDLHSTNMVAALSLRMPTATCRCASGRLLGSHAQRRSLHTDSSVERFLPMSCPPRSLGFVPCIPLPFLTPNTCPLVFGLSLRSVKKKQKNLLAMISTTRFFLLDGYFKNDSCSPSLCRTSSSSPTLA
jgi:hypothetical protein